MTSNMTPLTTVYKEINTTRITTDIYLPSQSPPPPPLPDQDVKHPVIIMLHGGAFMLGNSRLISQLHVEHCLSKGWIVLSPNHRLCPGVDVLEGPVGDCRDLLAWVYAGKLDEYLLSAEAGGWESGSVRTRMRADLERVAAVGCSSGGTLALCLGFDVPKPVKAIISFYGAVDFSNPLWKKPVPEIQALLPSTLTREFIEQVYDEVPVPTDSSISLEGQSDSTTTATCTTTSMTDNQENEDPNKQRPPQKPDFSKPRDAFAFTQLGNGTVLDAIYPQGASRGFGAVDPMMNISPSFPPTYILHGAEDNMVPIELSRNLFAGLRRNGVDCGILEVPGEGHTFAMRMALGDATWRRQRVGWEFLEDVLR